MKPQPLFAERNVLPGPVRRRLSGSRKVILFLDFDGTLVPIRKKPSLARLAPNTGALLRRLAHSPGILVGLVTGRSHSDIAAKVRLSRLFLITNHGFEIVSGTSHWVHPEAARTVPILEAIAGELETSIGSIPGVLIENKGYTVSVHYRNVQRQIVPLVKRRVARSLTPYEGSAKTTSGKRVLEIRPNLDWNKGFAVMKFLRSQRPPHTAFVAYIGDDATDEDAFRLLPRRAVTIVVGKRMRSAAAYWVPSPRHVVKFLELVASTNIDGGQDD